MIGVGDPLDDLDGHRNDDHGEATSGQDDDPDGAVAVDEESEGEVDGHPEDDGANAEGNQGGAVAGAGAEDEQCGDDVGGGIKQTLQMGGRRFCGRRRGLTGMGRGRYQVEAAGRHLRTSVELPDDRSDRADAAGYTLYRHSRG